jgi:hypothetical protein
MHTPPATPALLLEADSPEVTAFLVAWHENGRASFERQSASLVYDEYKVKRAVTRSRWICLDVGPAPYFSGVFVVDRATGHVYTIKAYGRPNRLIGTLRDLTAEYQAATATYRAARS